MKTVTAGVLALLIALFSATKSHATVPPKACLIGTDPIVPADIAQISAVRAMVDEACVCSLFDGSTGKTHGDYVACANHIINQQAMVPPGALRPQCKRTVKGYYQHSTCGRNPLLHVQPCVKMVTNTGAVSCKIKPTTKADGFSPNDTCIDGTLFSQASCPGVTHCIEAADSNGDFRIGKGDSGACIGPIGGANRPVAVHVPLSYRRGTPVPLVVMLHGYGASGDIEEGYLGITALSDQHGFLYVHPDGVVDGIGNRFWNATDSCCDLFGKPVDDSTYLSGVIAGMLARYSVDPKRVYLMGHSNGAFMSYRMACDHAGQIAAIVSLAGAMYNDTTQCNPSSPVSVLEIHGTADMIIPYTGGILLGNPFPGAVTSVGDWVTFDGCDNTPDTSGAPLDLDMSLFGAETTVTQYAAGCAAQSAVELWTILDGGHIPVLSSEFTPDFIDFLLAHPKP